jgi:putative FmdB family regulatory protein
VPTYEYRCEKCGETFEMMQSFSARPLRRHQGCGGGVEKVFHPRGVTFKGSGFYVNDSRPKATSSEKGSNGESSSNGESKSDTPKKTTEPATTSASGETGSAPKTTQPAD